jgi:hypothetical protein
VADNDDLFAEFQEFLSAKRSAEDKEKSEEDYDVEVWDKDGRGARVRRSHARPFLQTLGIDLDPKPDTETDTDKTKDKGKAKPTGSTTAPGPVTKRYFSPKTPKTGS